MKVAHPPGIFLVSATEMWERFSYYGISALFVLYLTAAPASGGFGWATDDAVRLYGLYAGLAFAGPAVGGWVSSSVLGERRCIVIGATAIMFGHVLLGGPAYFPLLMESLSGLPVSSILQQSGVVQGQLLPDDSILASLAVAAQAAGTQAPRAVTIAYLLRGWSFVAGLGLVVIGTALIKPTISSIVGKLYAPDDPRRVFGFTLFMAGIWGGAFTANFAAGTLGERVGWHYGFMAAAIGMGIGLTSYLLLQQRLLGDLGREPDRRHPGASPFRLLSETTPRERQQLAALLVMSLFTVVYSIAFYQEFGLLTLFVKESVDRSIAGFEIPASWFLSVSTLSFLLFAPAIGAVLARRGRSPGPASSLEWGLGALACGYIVLIVFIDRHVIAQGSPVPMMWFIAAYAFFGIGDAFIWPAQLAIVTALAPRSMTSFAVGVWYVTVGAGTYIAGIVGAWGERVGVVQALLAILALLCASIVVVRGLRGWFETRCATLNGRPSQ
jgi:POT family proton-dependent oligopeptide transporter